MSKGVGGCEQEEFEGAGIVDLFVEFGGESGIPTQNQALQMNREGVTFSQTAK